MLFNIFLWIYNFAKRKNSSTFATLLQKATRLDSLAQLVEHNTFNVGVPGSSPGGFTEKPSRKRWLFLSFGLSGRSFGRNVAPSHTIFASQESGKSPFVGIWRTVKSRYLCNERKDSPLCTGSGNIRLRTG